MDLRLTLHLGQMESGINIGPSYTSIHKAFKNCKLIATLGAELELEIPNHVANISVINSFSYGSSAHVTEYAQELQTLKDVPVDQITRLRCLLDVGEDARQEFLRAHSMLSAAVIESCEKEIEHLISLGAQRLFSLVREQDARIEQLLSTLHVIRPQAERGDDFQVTLDCNEEELKYLMGLHSRWAFPGADWTKGRNAARAARSKSGARKEARPESRTEEV
jgi:hypothetical protein